MRSSHKGIADSVLFALNVFIIVLLAAGDKLAVPQWLQPMGRLHPLILHFPIAILMLGMLLEYFRFNPRFATEQIYQSFTDYLLVCGVVLSGVTVITGLFLSSEPGYEGDTLQWHKWFGVSVVFIGSIIYMGRNAARYNAGLAKVATIIVLICLVFTGHFGANLTHGDDFLLGPVLDKKDERAPLDQALVFKDVIQPIFKEKCISCHNPDKLKGGLLLTDVAGVLKGGKNGKLFVPGKPEISLLLQRIHLPEDDKKHMPPLGKSQLTDKEATLLYLWVKTNPDLKKKVIDLPATDSLRMIAATLLKPAESSEETYDFGAAGNEDIKKLNNNYRVIYPLAQESPALGVNIYNKTTYNVKVLEELEPLRKQIVTLDLNKMPVKDADLKTIAKFENLRHLNLNFSDITGSSFKELIALKYLKTLSVAGAPVKPGTLATLKSLPSLVQLTAWGTAVTDEELTALQKSKKNLQIIKGYKDDGAPSKLSPPQLKNAVRVFAGSVELQLAHPIKGVQIRYTTDGSQPDSAKSNLYKPGIMINQNTTIKAKAFKAGWLGSDSIQVNFFKNSYTPDSIWFAIAPNDKYKGDGAKTLIDKEFGGSDFGNGKWIASRTSDFGVIMEYKKPVAVQLVSVNTIRRTESFIFLPTALEVWGGADAQHLKLLATLKTPPPKKTDAAMTGRLDCRLAKPTAVSCIKLIAKHLQVIPAWHPGKGQTGWAFIDEVFVN